MGGDSHFVPGNQLMQLAPNEELAGWLVIAFKDPSIVAKNSC